MKSSARPKMLKIALRLYLRIFGYASEFHKSLEARARLLKHPLRIYLPFLASLKVTISCLFGLSVLIFWGTMVEVAKGIQVVQKEYFQSFFIWAKIPGLPFFIPYFPGGYFFSGALLINLLAAYAFRFKLTKHKIGILIIHLGLMLFIIGEIVNGIFSIESHMAIKIGEITNYSESLRRIELAVIETSHPEYEQVVSFPEKLLRKKNTFSHPSLPFFLKAKVKYPNARLLTLEDSHAKLSLLANRGIGEKIWVEPLPPIEQDDKVDNFTTFIELQDAEHSLGTWLLSNAISSPQSFSYKGKEYTLAIRRKRYYHPFSVQLTNFVHEMHAGTSIPKNYSSSVTLYGNEGKRDRETMIYMNNPLRYRGKTFYQSGYGDSDTVSVLQVVDNPGRLFPYLSSILVSVGLLVQFMSSIYHFKIKKRS